MQRKIGAGAGAKPTTTRCIGQAMVERDEAMTREVANLAGATKVEPGHTFGTESGRDWLCGAGDKVKEKIQ